MIRIVNRMQAYNQRALLQSVVVNILETSDCHILRERVGNLSRNVSLFDMLNKRRQVHVSVFKIGWMLFASRENEAK